jgi:SAM-dependent methyltransferase
MSLSSSSTQLDYIGTELPTFALARNWKRYVAHILRPYIRGDVLEVGAGLGAAAQALFNSSVTRWVGVEPDLRLASSASNVVIDPTGRISQEVLVGTLDDVPEGMCFDTIVYIDVLEHIEDDQAEMRLAATRLRAAGRVIVLAPAFPFVFSPFDRAVGHHRRYTVATLAAVMPSELECLTLRYADSFGLVLNLINRLVLRQTVPSVRQVRFWDRLILPVSRVADLALRHVFGRSVIAVYARRA